MSSPRRLLAAKFFTMRPMNAACDDPCHVLMLWRSAIAKVWDNTLYLPLALSGRLMESFRTPRPPDFPFGPFLATSVKTSC